MTTNKAILLVLEQIIETLDKYLPGHFPPASPDMSAVHKALSEAKKAVQADEDGIQSMLKVIGDGKSMSHKNEERITGFPWIDLTHLAFKVLRDNGANVYNLTGWDLMDDEPDCLVLTIEIQRTPQEVADLTEKYCDAIASSEHYPAEATMRFHIIFKPAGDKEKA